MLVTLKIKLFLLLAGSSLLIGGVGLTAVYLQNSFLRTAARAEAENVAQMLAAAVAFAPDEAAVPLLGRPHELQAFVDTLGLRQGREVDVLDADGRVLADADRANVGRSLLDAPEIAATLADGEPRAFATLLPRNAHPTPACRGAGGNPRRAVPRRGHAGL
jgi:hypothetical protein